MKETCLFSSDMPDPAILREGNYFYLTCSSMNYCPGLLIWRSENLREWERVCYVVEQWMGDIWAPELVKHKGMFYVYFPVNTNGYIRNFVSWSEHIEYGWSEPQPIGAEYMIDPGFVTDGECCWLYFNDGRCARLSEDCLSLREKPKKVWEPWEYPEQWETEGICAESPKIFYKNGYYFLIAAEGGTSGPPTSHMAVCFRSKSPTGPWKTSPYNPVIHTYSADEDWWSIGHATYFEDKSGEGWFIFHGYRNGKRNMGRQILLCRVKWTSDGFPIAADTEEFGIVQPDFTDDFKAQKLDLSWSFYKNCDSSRYSVGKGLRLHAVGQSISDCCPMTVNTRFSDCTVECTVEACSPGCAAGLLFFYNEKASLGVYIKNSTVTVSYLEQSWVFRNVSEESVAFRFIRRNDMVSVYCSSGDGAYQRFEKIFDVSCFEHNHFKGYLSCRAGLCCFGEGNAVFKDFSYRRLKD